jgi:membrane fusion protein (multidrug efflux system)
VENTKSSQQSKEEKSARAWMSGFGRPALWIALVIILLAAVAGTLIYKYYSVRETTDDAQIDGHINPIAARIGVRGAGERPDRA